MPLPALPISEHEDEIIAAVEANPVVVVIAETGSGKSTKLSQILHRRGYTRRGAIAVTQPRRVAAVSVSRCLPFLLYSTGTRGSFLDPPQAHCARLIVLGPTMPIRFCSSPHIGYACQAVRFFKAAIRAIGVIMDSD